MPRTARPWPGQPGCERLLVFAPVTQRPWLGWLLAAALAIAGLALLVWLVPGVPLEGDGRFYLQQVRSGFDKAGAAAWHERRILMLQVVARVPLDALEAFRVVTLACLFVTTLLTYGAARALGSTPARAVTAVALLFGTWTMAPSIREYALVDAMAWAFSAAVWLAAIRRCWLLVAILGAIGVLAKEMVAVAATGAALAAIDRRRLVPSVGLAALVALPSWLSVVGLLVFLPASTPDATLVSYIPRQIVNGLGSLGPWRVLYLMFISQAALWLLLPLGLRRLPPHARQAALGVTALSLLLPAVGTPERMVAMAFPALISSGVAATRDWAAWRVWLFALGNALFVARAGGTALNAPIGWGGLAVAAVLAAWAYMPRTAIGTSRRDYRAIAG